MWHFWLLFLATGVANGQVFDFAADYKKKQAQEKARIKYAAPVIQLKPDNFDEEFNRPGRPLVLGFVSSTCPHCRRLTSELQDWAVRFNESLRIGIVEVGRGIGHPELFEKVGFKLKKVPKFWFVQNGDVVSRYFGYPDAKLIQGWLAFNGGLSLTPAEHIVLTNLARMVHHWAAVLTFFGIEPTDAGSGGGPLPDGGTLGAYAIFAGAAVAIIIAIILMLTCCCCQGKSKSKVQ